MNIELKVFVIQGLSFLGPIGPLVVALYVSKYVTLINLGTLKYKFKHMVHLHIPQQHPNTQQQQHQ